MKNQRWKGDYETIKQEFRSSRKEEEMGMHDDNMNRAHDFLAYEPTRRLDKYQTDELLPSWSTQLDTTGMQPHAREYLERDETSMRSARKFTMIAGLEIDYCEGIQFSGYP